MKTKDVKKKTIKTKTRDIIRLKGLGSVVGNKL
jgi:hypothetical protein